MEENEVQHDSTTEKIAPKIMQAICAAGGKANHQQRDWFAKRREMQPRLQAAIERGAKLAGPILDNHDIERPILFENEEGAWKVWVLSEGLASRTLLNEPYIHITVTDTGEYNLEPLQANLPHLVAYLPLKFDDCEKPVNGFYLFNEEQAKAIWNVIEENKDRAKLIVVNCHAGLCRSSGIAAAVAEHLNGNPCYGKAVFELFAPNKTVWSTLRDHAPK